MHTVNEFGECEAVGITVVEQGNVTATNSTATESPPLTCLSKYGAADFLTPPEHTSVGFCNKKGSFLNIVQITMPPEFAFADCTAVHIRSMSINSTSDCTFDFSVTYGIALQIRFLMSGRYVGFSTLAGHFD